MKLRTIIFITIFAFSVIAFAGPSKDLRMGTISKSDFFFYSCVRQYMLANSIKVFDGSVNLGVEYSNLNYQELMEIGNKSKAYAASIRAPDYSDSEHGLSAVLILCQEEGEKIYGAE
ncbi:hypothetical protein [Sessilibacter sp. MAH2]